MLNCSTIINKGFLYLYYVVIQDCDRQNSKVAPNISDPTSLPLYNLVPLSIKVYLSITSRTCEYDDSHSP